MRGWQRRTVSCVSLYGNVVGRFFGFADHACSTSANDDNLLPAILEQLFVRHGRDVSSGRILIAMNGCLDTGEEQLFEEGEGGEVYVDVDVETGEREGEMDFAILPSLPLVALPC